MKIRDQNVSGSDLVQEVLRTCAEMVEGLEWSMPEVQVVDFDMCRFDHPDKRLMRMLAKSLRKIFS